MRDKDHDRIYEIWGLGLQYAPTVATYLADIYHIECILDAMLAATKAHERGEINVHDPWSYDSDHYPKLCSYFDEHILDDGSPYLCGECFQALNQ